MGKFFNRDEKDDNLSDIFIEINYDRSNEIKSVSDIENIENKFKKVQGINSVKFVPKKSNVIIPDIIAIANWDKDEINNKINEIKKIPNVKEVTWKELLEA